MKTINIYLTKLEQNKAKEVQMKYKISLSTLVSTVTYELVNILIKSNNQEKLESLINHYLSKENTFKTSVKPKVLIKGALDGIKNKNCLATNSLSIYLNGNIKKYVDREWINKYYTNIDNELRKTFDKYWDYNSGIRNQTRMIRENKDYWKRILDEV